MIEAKQINRLDSNVESPPQNMAGSEQKKRNHKQTPIQMQNVITKMTMPPRIQALSHSLSHSRTELQQHQEGPPHSSSPTASGTAH